MFLSPQSIPCEILPAGENSEGDGDEEGDEGAPPSHHTDPRRRCGAVSNAVWPMHTGTSGGCRGAMRRIRAGSNHLRAAAPRTGATCWRIPWRPQTPALASPSPASTCCGVACRSVSARFGRGRMVHVNPSQDSTTRPACHLCFASRPRQEDLGAWQPGTRVDCVDVKRESSLLPRCLQPPVPGKSTQGRSLHCACILVNLPG